MAHVDNPAEHWNLGDLYANDAAWEAAFVAQQQRLAVLGTFRTNLTTSAKTLADGLDLLYAIDKEVNRLGSYAGKRADENLKDATALGLRQRIELLGTELSQAASFVEPAVLAAGRKTIEGYLAREPRLQVYGHKLDDVLRRAPHTLDAKGEQLLATSGLMADAPSTLYSILTNAELPWPSVTLSDGTTVRLDQSAYTKYRSSPNRADRELVFRTFWGKWAEYQQTLGVALYANLKKDRFYQQARTYPSCLAQALDADNVPEAVYRTLVATTNTNLPTLHRYFQLRGRMLGLTDLRYHDLYPPLVTSDRAYPIEDGKKLVLEAVAPLGDDYVTTVRQGFAERWMDTYPRQGKRSGAYSSGSAYDVHPYVLMNYNDDYESVSTLAHEWGHTMHSYLANASQPYPRADYAIFVAEVASTFNEGLLLDYVLKHAKSDEEKLFYLGSALEGLRTTFFRQTMFAEYELGIHERAEKGEALTGARLTELYGELLKRYHGHAQGVVTIDDAYTVEWAFIPHFYYNFYVYKYATSIAAASLLVDEVLANKIGARERYLGVLKAGGSQYPYEILKAAGVDLATPAPYEALVRRMNGIMNQIEAILDRRPS